MKYWKISSQFPSPSQDNFYQCHRCSRLIDSIRHSISYIDRNWAEMEKYNDIQRNGLPVVWGKVLYAEDPIGKFANQNNILYICPKLNFPVGCTTLKTLGKLWTRILKNLWRPRRGLVPKSSTDTLLRYRRLTANSSKSCQTLPSTTAMNTRPMSST